MLLAGVKIDTIFCFRRIPLIFAATSVRGVSAGQVSNFRASLTLTPLTLSALSLCCLFLSSAKCKNFSAQRNTRPLSLPFRNRRP